MDFAGPVKGDVFLIVVDAYTNWAEVEILSSMKAAAVVTSLRKMFATYGVPDVIVSDNGTAFTSAELRTFLKCNGVRTVFTAPYHPASNGRAERMVREVKEALKSNRKDQHSARFRGSCLNSTRRHILSQGNRQQE